MNELYKPLPNIICIDGSTDGRWLWQMDSFDDYPEIFKKLIKREPFRLPPDVFNKLKGGELETMFPGLKNPAKNRIYDTFEEAMQAMNSACSPD